MSEAPLRIEYDREVDAAYIYLRKAKVAATKQITPYVLCDVDSDGCPVGFEVLFASKSLQGLQDALALGHIALKPVEAS